MLCKVLVITVICALTVGFPSLDIDSINGDLQDLIIDSTSGQVEPYEVSIAPTEDDTDKDSNTDLGQTTDPMPAKESYSRNRRNSEFSTDADIDSTFLPDTTETLESTMTYTWDN